MFKIIKYHILNIIIVGQLVPLLLFGVTSPVNKKQQRIEIVEPQLQFTYHSTDGEIQLNCTHYKELDKLNDWMVWCGKGTPLFRQFKVHLLIQRHASAVLAKTGLEVLYWVIDRDQPSTQAFQSSSQWFEFDSVTSLKKMKLRQGVENDYAQLAVEFNN